MFDVPWLDEIPDDCGPVSRKSPSRTLAGRRSSC